MKSIARIAASLAVLLAIGCGGGSEPDANGAPIISLDGTLCSLCGMEIRDTHFASALREASGEVRSFDAIECLIQDRREHGGLDEASIWLPDLGEGQLYPAERMTIVRGGFPSPMGGGFAAFRDAELAGRLTAERKGQAGSLADFVRGGRTGGGR